MHLHPAFARMVAVETSAEHLRRAERHPSARRRDTPAGPPPEPRRVIRVRTVPVVRLAVRAIRP